MSGTRTPYPALRAAIAGNNKAKKEFERLTKLATMAERKGLAFELLGIQVKAAMMAILEDVKKSVQSISGPQRKKRVRKGA
jgi:hypothetical protein